ncbi:DUF4913 domain-containing protein [Micromonospora okii]|uniref:DUF4913 domain-containing protein n=1 Tax=Micromonospora okii TaxID=1182970 RepID=UPI001E649702|nr:DUF4913 domain-containing protein [Micromonospora okii]
MMQVAREPELRAIGPPEASPQPTPLDGQEPEEPFFILYLAGPDYREELRRLTDWVNNLLVPVYGREVTSGSPWCPEWPKHPEAVAQFHGLWLAWQENTGPKAPLSGPALWHRDHLGPVMQSLRDPSGPFAGCRRGHHREKEVPYVDD